MYRLVSSLGAARAPFGIQSRGPRTGSFLRCRDIATCSGEQFRANASRYGVLFCIGVGSTSIYSACRLLLASRPFQNTVPLRCMTQVLWQVGLPQSRYACQVCPIQQQSVFVLRFDRANALRLVRLSSQAWVDCAARLCHLSQAPFFLHLLLVHNRLDSTYRVWAVLPSSCAGYATSGDSTSSWFFGTCPTCTAICW